MANVAITGAGRGIGFELVKQYAEAGDRVFALCRSPEKANALNELAAESDGKVSVHAMDVGNDASVKAAAAATGDGPIDVLLNVAGVIGGERQGLEDQAWDDWQEAFNVMIIGPLRVMQAFLPRLGVGAKVVNITSQLAASTWPYGGYYAYGAAKAGLNRMMRSVALDVKDRGIVIGLVHPGWVQTDMGGAAAEITSEESASGIRKVSAEWTLGQSGDFKKWNGESHDW
jgi:NAD(P)-dependent dehydrogenase (short-subunit alcohol dehydrogenase family)